MTCRLCPSEATRFFKLSASKGGLIALCERCSQARSQSDSFDGRDEEIDVDTYQVACVLAE